MNSKAQSGQYQTRINPSNSTKSLRDCEAVLHDLRRTYTESVLSGYDEDRERDKCDEVRRESVAIASFIGWMYEDDDVPVVDTDEADANSAEHREGR